MVFSWRMGVGSIFLASSARCVYLDFHCMRRMRGRTCVSTSTVQREVLRVEYVCT